ncbi:hypothetical protein [Rhodoferax sp.]|uniref:AbiTii domain-containing protein n=1 Tax=Rhodoferax sp. TaxID=50421 RepID=UPI002770E087|nr:hypothetical protein [Rhodoferax sp.]
MSGFDQVVKLTEEEPLSRSLPAALRLATSLPDQAWAEWLRLEVMGYFNDNPSMNKGTVVPTYRSVPGEWHDEHGRPLVLTDPKLGFVNQIPLRYGVAELEAVAGKVEGSVAMRLPDQAQIIREVLKVEVSVFQFRPSSVAQVLTNIRLTALDHLWARKTALATLSAEGKLEKQEEIFLLRPAIWGVGLDLKALWRKTFRRR